MKEQIFLEIVNMSISASIIIAFVVFARAFLKKMPKIYSYILWVVVLFRLLCPVSVSTDFSLLGFVGDTSISGETITTSVEYIPSEIVNTEQVKVDAFEVEVEASDEWAWNQTFMSFIPLASNVWIIGIVMLLLNSSISYLKLRKKIVGAVHLHDNIYMADQIETPFVMGIFRPRIYLISSMEEKEQELMILHEQHHIRRKDHVIKLLAYFSVCVHWFNPLVWFAYILSNKDMEMSCDEAVIRKMGEEVRADYSLSLLNVSTGQNLLSGMPLAFGEGDIRGRIINLAKWKKPAIWGTILAALACFIIILVSASNPKEETLIEEFLSTWFGDSEENEELYNLMYENATVIGAGVESTPAEQAEQYAKNVKKTSEAFRNVYGGYLTEEALGEFVAEQYSLPYSIFTENEEWEIADVNVRKDTEDYWFEIEIVVNGESDWPYLVQGRIELKDGKINKIKNPLVNRNPLEISKVFIDDFCKEIEAVVSYGFDKSQKTIIEQEGLDAFIEILSGVEGVQTDKSSKYEGGYWFDILDSQNKIHVMTIYDSIIIVDGNVFKVEEEYAERLVFVSERYGESAVFEAEEIQKAEDSLLLHFAKELEGCEIIQVGYNDAVQRKIASQLEVKNNSEVMILMSDFQTKEEIGDFEADSVYEDWMWILVKEAGEWKVED